MLVNEFVQESNATYFCRQIVMWLLQNRNEVSGFEEYTLSMSLNTLLISFTLFVEKWVSNESILNIVIIKTVWATSRSESMVAWPRRTIGGSKHCRVYKDFKSKVQTCKFEVRSDVNWILLFYVLYKTTQTTWITRPNYTNHFQ